MENVRFIDGYKIKRFCEGKRVGIFIIYQKQNKFYVSSKYYNVSEEKIKKVTKALDHFTKINRETKNACEKITLITFLTEVNRIIIGK